MKITMGNGTQLTFPDDMGENQVYFTRSFLYASPEFTRHYFVLIITPFNKYMIYKN